MSEDEELKRILDTVLKSEYVRKQRQEREVKSEIAFHGVPSRAMDFETENIHQFFDQDIEKLVEYPEVWAWLQRQIKDDIDGVWSEPKTLLPRLNSEGHITSEKTIYSIIESLRDDVCDLFIGNLRETWTLVTVANAKKILPKGAYIVTLDKNGKLTTEPHMVSMLPDAKVTWKIKDEQSRLGKVRELEVSITPDVTTERGKYGKVGFRLKSNEVKATVFSIR